MGPVGLETPAPRILRCPTCSEPVAASADLCFRCGAYLPPDAFDGER